ncbi:hypothetical protein Q8F57_000485 [Paraburkholderia terrae]|uniref:hypothetical protein n=1 Tax=Paraburkholderia terrae TaxID=311230 RepID=UPI00296ABD8C|nr:hypothetical protein [Paraburkholderia terrae]MDW3660593.1 hypothetical protein [Paraburkholderia terrae]
MISSIEAYRRKVLFALEVLDAVMLAPLSRGVSVVAQGLRGTPVVNRDGMFVWLDEDLNALQKVSIDPGDLPYERIELMHDDLNLPQEHQLRRTIVMLPTRIDYAFPSGMTGLRGKLIESNPIPPDSLEVPVANATVSLRWLDGDGNMNAAPGIFRTNASGDFVAVLRFAPGDAPQVGDAGQLTVRLRVHRGDHAERESDDVQLPQGELADPMTYAKGRKALIFAWDVLHA